MRWLIPTLLALAALPAADTVLPATVGKPFIYVPHFRGMGLTYAAEGMPDGLALDPASGALGGTPRTAGRHEVVIVARNAAGSVRLPVVVEVAGEPAPAPAAAAPGVRPPPPPPPAAKAEEEDTPDPLMAAGVQLAPWTEKQRRVIHHWFLPGAAGLPAGDWYYRISHVAREGFDRQPLTNLAGLDDSVKIGIMVGWAPVKTLTLTLQRVNGRDLAVAPQEGENIQYDVWEPMAQWQVLDQRGVRGLLEGPCDLSLLAGESLLVRNHGLGDASVNVGAMAERDLFDDRLRLGVGLVHAGLSAYEKPISSGNPAPDKRYPDEQDYLASEGSPVKKVPAGTTAVPITARVAIAERWFLLAEAVIPVSGYRTGAGPAYAAGFAFDTNTHEFAFMLSNTANLSFNSVVTGGWKPATVPFFGFSITAYL